MEFTLGVFWWVAIWICFTLLWSYREGHRRLNVNILSNGLNILLPMTMVVFCFYFVYFDYKDATSDSSSIVTTEKIDIYKIIDNKVVFYDFKGRDKSDLNVIEDSEHNLYIDSVYAMDMTNKIHVSKTTHLFGFCGVFYRPTIYKLKLSKEDVISELEKTDEDALIPINL